MVVGVPGRLERLDPQAACLERALDDLEPVALDELVVAGDVVRVRVCRQQVRDGQALPLDDLVLTGTSSSAVSGVWPAAYTCSTFRRRDSARQYP